MTKKDVIDEKINYWKEWANKNSHRYDIALFKIWIQFEKYIGELFVNYALGKKSERGYRPKLKLKFSTEEQLNALSREGNKPYIEYLVKIEKISKHIFDRDPFQIILLDSDYRNVFNQIKSIRNYIAHESGEAKLKYTNICLSGDSRKFKEPNEFLKQQEKESGLSFFSYYINSINNMTELLIDPPDDL